MAVWVQDSGAAAGASGSLGDIFTVASFATCAPTGGIGGRAAISCAASGGHVAADVLFATATMTCGTYFRTPALPGANGLTIFRWDQGLGTNTQGSLYLTSTGTLEFHKGALISDPLIGSASAVVIAVDTDYHITANYQVSGNALLGRAQAWVDSTQVLNITAATLVGGTAQIQRQYWGSTVDPQLSGPFLIGDVYSTSDNTFHGPCEVLRLVPLAVGFYDGIPLGAGADKVVAVTGPPVNDATYIQTSGGGTQIESYFVTPLLTGTSPISYTVHARQQNLNAGAVGAFFRSPGGVDTQINNVNVNETSFRVPQRFLVQMNFDSTTLLQGYEWGVNRNATGLGIQAKISELWVNVLVNFPAPRNTRRRWVDMIGT